jgi:hypothetical protein
LAEYDIRKLEEFKFDDATSLGYLRLEKIREAQELVKRVEVDKAALQGTSALLAGLGHMHGWIRAYARAGRNVEGTCTSIHSYRSRKLSATSPSAGPEH